MFGRDKQDFLVSHSLSLKLLRCSSSPSVFHQNLPSAFTPWAMGKILLFKNKRQRRQAMARLKSGSSKLDLDYKVYQEMEAARQEIQLYQPTPIQTKRAPPVRPRRTRISEDTCSNREPAAEQPHQLQLKDLCEGELELARKLGLHEKGQESLPVIINAFQHMLNAEESTSLLVLESTRSATGIVLRSYKSLLSSISDKGSPLSFFQKCLQAIANGKCLNSGQTLNPLFSLISGHIHTYFRLLDVSSPTPTALDEFRVLESFSEEFGSHDSLRGPQSEDGFWVKMASLLRKSSKYHSLIEVHLLEHKEERLLEYFRKVVRGEEGAFEADRVLLERNFSYRQFVLILQRKWTEEAATDPLSQEDIAAVIKQLLLKRQFHENCQREQECLQKYVALLVIQLQEQLAKESPAEPLEQLVRKLLFLGQLSPVIRALDRESKIDTVQALLLTSMLFSLDLSRCKLVLFCPEGNKGLFVQLLRKLFGSAGCELELTELLAAFSPIIGFLEHPQLLISQILTIKLPLFKFVTNELSLLPYLQTIGLSAQHIPLLMQQLLTHHACFSYCAKIGLSSCVSMASLKALVGRPENSLDRGHAKQDEETQSLNLMLRDENWHGIAWGNLPQAERLNTFAELVPIFTKFNFQLFFETARRAQDQREALASAHLLCLLLKKPYRGLLARDSNCNSIQPHLDLIQGRLRALQFSAAILELKRSNSMCSYRTIVDSFNYFLQEMVPNYQLIISSMSHLLGQPSAFDLMEDYLEQLVQAIMLIRAGNRKLLQSNKALFRELLTNLLGIARRCRQYRGREQGEERPYSNAIEEQLQGLLRTSG